MKHVVERAIGKYLANGEFVAGALITGYTFKYTDGLNVEFGMSARDVKRIRSAAPQTGESSSGRVGLPEVANDHPAVLSA